MGDDAHVGRQLSEAHEHEEHDHAFEGLDRIMGVSLVLGFIFMMLVDQVAAYMSGNGNRSNSTGDVESLVHSSATFPPKVLNNNAYKDTKMNKKIILFAGRQIFSCRIIVVQNSGRNCESIIS